MPNMEQLRKIRAAKLSLWQILLSRQLQEREREKGESWSSAKVFNSICKGVKGALRATCSEAKVCEDSARWSVIMRLIVNCDWWWMWTRVGKTTSENVKASREDHVLFSVPPFSIVDREIACGCCLLLASNANQNSFLNQVITTPLTVTLHEHEFRRNQPYREEYREPGFNRAVSGNSETVVAVG